MSIETERIVRDTKHRYLGGKRYTAQASGKAIYDGDKNLTQLIFSTVLENSNEQNIYGEPLGFINYFDDAVSIARNTVVRLDFYKPINFAITAATLFVKYTDVLDGVSNQRLTNASIQLNPAKSKITDSVYDYYRFSGGTVIRSGFTATSDEESTRDELNSTQIEAITDGWNSLVIQQETNDTGGTLSGFATMNFILDGYTN